MCCLMSNKRVTLFGQQPVTEFCHPGCAVCFAEDISYWKNLAYFRSVQMEIFNVTEADHIIDQDRMHP